MKTFPSVNDIGKYGTYRTKDLGLAAYDCMDAAEAVGKEYETLITPPPSQGPRHPIQTSS